MRRSNIVYLQMAGILLSIGAALYFGAMHEFAWGNVQMLSDGATINDVWAYNLSAFSNAALAGALACFGVQLLDQFSDSMVCWALKYGSIAFALAMSCRALFHIIFYDRVVVLEVLVQIRLLIYTLFRAVKWYKINLKHKYGNIARRHTLENN